METYYKGSDSVAEGFKAGFSRECKPHFIGVWDTVGSIGWISRKQFSNNRLNPDVSNAYHALAIDERRHHFRPSVWEETDLIGHQTIEQIWFIGGHGDVGGQEADRRISDISLEWMLERAKVKGLLLKKDWGQSLDPDYSGNIKRSERGIWKLGAKDRFIARRSRIHQPALGRMVDSDFDYAPQNLSWVGLDVIRAIGL